MQRGCNNKVLIVQAVEGGPVDPGTEQGVSENNLGDQRNYLCFPQGTRYGRGSRFLEVGVHPERQT